MAIASRDSSKAKETSYFGETTGKISNCTLLGCFGKCCEFTRPGYNIILHPGELQAAYDSGLSTDHLLIVNDDYHGGQLAVCVAHNKIDCDQGYKPHDCFYYPLFPSTDKATGAIGFIGDPRCKLIAAGCDLSDHMEKTEKLVASLLQQDPKLNDFFAKDDPKDWIPVLPQKVAQSPASCARRCTLEND